MMYIQQNNGTFQIVNLQSSGGSAVTSVNGLTGAVSIGLQSVTDVEDTTTDDIEITDYTKGIILRDSGGARARITLTDDGFGNLQLTLTAL